MNRYPTVMDDSPSTLKRVLDFITRERQRDVDDWNGLPQRFIGGRRVSKVPANSSDITGSTVGDFNVTTSFAYFCVNNAGTPTWVRVAVGSF